MIFMLFLQTTNISKSVLTVTRKGMPCISDQKNCFGLGFLSACFLSERSILPHVCLADPPVYDATVGKLNQNKGSMKQGTKYTFSSL